MTQCKAKSQKTTETKHTGCQREGKRYKVTSAQPIKKTKQKRPNGFAPNRVAHSSAAISTITPINALKSCELVNTTNATLSGTNTIAVKNRCFNTLPHPRALHHRPWPHPHDLAVLARLWPAQLDRRYGQSGAVVGYTL